MRIRLLSPASRLLLACLCGVPFHAHGSGRIRLVGGVGFLVEEMPGWSYSGSAYLHKAASNDFGSAFFGTMRESSTNVYADGVFIGGPGAVTPLAWEGSDAPGARAGAVFSSLGDYTYGNGYPYLRSSGNREVAFSGFVRSGSTEDFGHWRYHGGILRDVAIERVEYGAHQYSPIFEQLARQAALIDSNGVATFTARASMIIDGARSTRVGLWAHGDDGLRPIAYEGSQVPSLGTGVTFSRFEWGPNPAPLRAEDVSRSGDIVFSAEFAGPGVGPWNDSAIFRTRAANGPSIVAREGQIAPGLDGHVFSFMNAARSVADGPVAFRALAERASDGERRDGIWIRDENGLRNVAYGGSLIPGAQGLNVKYFDDRVFVNTQSDIAFGGQGDGGLQNIYAGKPDSIESVLRQNDSVEIEGRHAVFSWLSLVAQNERGQLLILGHDDDGYRLVAHDPMLGFISVVREGQRLEVAPGIFMKAVDITRYCSSVMLSDTGIVTFSAELEPMGSGPVVMTFSTRIPTPAAFPLLAIAALGTRRRRPSPKDA